MNREFTASRPDEIWAADVTQFWTTEGWLYFAGVIDLYSRRVVGVVHVEPPTPTWSSTP